VIVKGSDCVIERRLLVSYRIDPERVAALLPRPFLPRIVNGHAAGGVCFLRVRGVRARPGREAGRPGRAAEMVVHRFAVQWDSARGGQTGTYVPRRDTNSRAAAALGAWSRATGTPGASSRVAGTLGASPWVAGTLGASPWAAGACHYARFEVAESADLIRIRVRSRDRRVSLAVAAAPATGLSSALFAGPDEASDFFGRGTLEFSPAAGFDDRLDGVYLHTAGWAAAPMSVAQMRSSLFDDEETFPRGTCALDSAVLMTNVAARWTTDPTSGPPLPQTA